MRSTRIKPVVLIPVIQDQARVVYSLLIELRGIVVLGWSFTIMCDSVRTYVEFFVDYASAFSGSTRNRKVLVRRDSCGAQFA